MKYKKEKIHKDKVPYKTPEHLEKKCEVCEEEPSKKESRCQVCNQYMCEECFEGFCLTDSRKQHKCYFCDNLLCTDCFDKVSFSGVKLTVCTPCIKSKKQEMKCKTCDEKGEIGILVSLKFCDHCDNAYCWGCLTLCSNVIGSGRCEYARGGYKAARVCENCRCECKDCHEYFCKECICDEDKSKCWDCHEGVDNSALEPYKKALKNR